MARYARGKGRGEGENVEVETEGAHLDTVRQPEDRTPTSLPHTPFRCDWKLTESQWTTKARRKLR